MYGSERPMLEPAPRISRPLAGSWLFRSRELAELQCPWRVVRNRRSARPPAPALQKRHWLELGDEARRVQAFAILPWRQSVFRRSHVQCRAAGKTESSPLRLAHRTVL